MLIFRAPTSTPTRAKPARLLKDVTSHEIADANEERRDRERERKKKEQTAGEDSIGGRGRGRGRGGDTF